jgi:hypothetical protein
VLSNIIQLQHYDIYVYIYMFVPALKVLARSRQPAPLYALSALPAPACQRLLASVLRYHYDIELSLAPWAVKATKNPDDGYGQNERGGARWRAARWTAQQEVPELKRQASERAEAMSVLMMRRAASAAHAKTTTPALLAYGVPSDADGQRRKGQDHSIH